MSSIRKSMSRESRCRIDRTCSAPSDVLATGADGAGALVSRLARLSSASTSGDSDPPNKRLKKQRKARTMRFNGMAPIFQDSGKRRASVRSTLLNHGRFAQPLQLPPRDFRPLSGMIQFQIRLPVMHGPKTIVCTFAQQRQVEMRVGIVGIQLQRQPVVFESFFDPPLLVIEVAQIEL